MPLTETGILCAQHGRAAPVWHRYLQNPPILGFVLAIHLGQGQAVAWSDSFPKIETPSQANGLGIGRGYPAALLRHTAESKF
ncbi:hypothetical protein D3C73_1516630 [compost metagenome]